MVEFPSEIMYDILSRMQVKSLARCRCVSKQWCNYINDSYFETMYAKRVQPMLITFHQLSSFYHPNSPCKLSFLEYKEDTLEMKKKPPAMEFMCRTRNFDYPYDIVQGSCNGLLYSSRRHNDVITLVVINPLRRECYDVPPMNTPFRPEPSWYPANQEKMPCVEWSCGLGFDDSTNTFKMVCVVPREQVQLKFDPVIEEHLCTMVHVLGTPSWRKIPQVPSYPIIGEGVFANGCLHWLARGKHDKFPIIRFDMKTEKIRLIESPRKRTTGLINVHLVDLHGQVGFVYMVMDCIVEVWVLKERRWVMHCKFGPKPHLPNGFSKVLGFWNENGDILMMTVTWGRRRLCVYNLKSGGLYEVVVVGLEAGVKDMRVYQSSLLSTRYSI